MVTHSIVEATYVAEQVVVMAPAPGRIVAQFTPSFAHHSPLLRATPEFAAVNAEVLRSLGEAMVGEQR
jgi:NitT/TauT family transport system ATP-binding protein